MTAEESTATATATGATASSCTTAIGGSARSSVPRSCCRHRVRRPSSEDRPSFPLFLDPSWDADVTALPEAALRSLPDDAASRWDRQSVHAWDGAHGDQSSSVDAVGTRRPP